MTRLSSLILFSLAMCFSLEVHAQQYNDSFSFDAAKAKKAHDFQSAYNTMIACVGDKTTPLIKDGKGKRSVIKAQTRSCADELFDAAGAVGISAARVRWMTADATESKINSLIADGQFGSICCSK